MKRPILLLRLAGVAVSLVSVIFTAIEFLYRRPGAPAATLLEILAVRGGVPAPFTLSLELAGIVLFALCFWLTTGEEQVFRWSDKAFALLG